MKRLSQETYLEISKDRETHSCRYFVAEDNGKLVIGLQDYHNEDRTTPICEMSGGNAGYPLEMAHRICDLLNASRLAPFPAFTPLAPMKTTQDKLPRIVRRLAEHLLTLPTGGWPETQQAEADLRDALPTWLTVESALLSAAQGNRHIHPSRRDNLARLGQACGYPTSTFDRIWPALSGAAS